MGIWVKRMKLGCLVLFAFFVVVYLNNTSLFSEPIADRPFLVAHRGLAQGFSREGLTGTTCTAARMLPSEHDFLENTIPSMAAAFELGADYVELDVQRTADDRFVVFHDSRLDCRTEASGTVRDYTLAELQALDIGYGYTADGGKTWPFRGRGVGQMPSLEQVLATFPDRGFVIDVKSNAVETGALLGERLEELVTARTGEIILTGGPRAVMKVKERLPQLRLVTRPRLKQCVMRYLALGWTGHVPDVCHGMMMTLPINVAPWVWGWPDRLLQRMDRVGTSVVLLGDYEGGKFSTGLDDPARLRDVPADYSGGFWTDRADRLGPVVYGASIESSQK